MNINKHILCSETFVEKIALVYCEELYTKRKTDESSLSTYPLNSLYNSFPIECIYYKGRRMYVHINTVRTHLYILQIYAERHVISIPYKNPYSHYEWL